MKKIDCYRYADVGKMQSKIALFTVHIPQLEEEALKKVRRLKCAGEGAGGRLQRQAM